MGNPVAVGAAVINELGLVVVGSEELELEPDDAGFEEAVAPSVTTFNKLLCERSYGCKSKLTWL